MSVAFEGNPARLVQRFPLPLPTGTAQESDTVLCVNHRKGESRLNHYITGMKKTISDTSRLDKHDKHDRDGLRHDEEEL